MKKILSFIVAILFVGSLVVSATTSNAKTREKAIVTNVAMSMGAVSIQTNVSRKAKVFKYLKSKHPANPVICEAQIRSEVYTKSGEGNYVFNLKANAGEGRTEQRLLEQDSFRVMEIGLFLMKESTTIPGIGVVETYPNPVSFPNEAGALQTEHLEHIYNGKLEIRFGDTLWVDGMPTSSFRVVRGSQQTSALNRTEKYGTDGLVDMVPQYTFNGNENNVVTVKVPADVAQKIESASATSGYKVKLVFILNGYKISGGTLTKSVAVAGYED